MDNTEIARKFDEINTKLDLLLSHLQEQQRRHREFEELKDDLTIIGKDIFQTAVLELEQVSPYFDSQDLAHLLKRLLRNTRNLTSLVDTIENAADFVQDAKPLTKHAFAELLDILNTLDKKGYFLFMKEAALIVDTVVTSFTPEDVRLLRENITSILLTVKNLTQPDLLGTLNNAVGFYKMMDIEVGKKVTYMDIMRQLSDPEVKRGLLFMLEFVKSMAKQNGQLEKVS